MDTTNPGATIMNITIIFIISTVLAIAVFDFWVIIKKGKQESVSAHIIRGSKQYPLLVLLFGIVLGHLFWSMRTEDIFHNTKCVEVQEGADAQDL